MTNFIDDVIDGKTKLDEIDDYVEKWHNSDSHCSVSEYLGMTEEEYFLWTEDNSNLKYIVLAHKNNINIKELLKTENMTWQKRISIKKPDVISFVIGKT